MPVPFSPFRSRASAQEVSEAVVPPEVSREEPLLPEAGHLPEAGRLPVEDVRLSMTRVIAAWGFGAAFFNLSSGAIYTAFARKIGADERDIGLLFAALPLMSFLQVISARIVEKTGKRKHQMMIAGLAGRGLWMLLPLLPLLALWFPGKITQRQVLPVFIVCVLLSSAFQAFTSPAFFSWMADLVPSRVRPKFFAQRMRTGTIAAIVSSLAGGFIADKYPNLNAYCVLLMIAGFCGIMDIALFFGVKEPPPSDAPPPESGKLPPLRESLGLALREPDVRRFLAFVALLTAGYGLTGAFAWLFALEYLGLSKTTTNLILNIAPLLGIALTSRFWGETIKRYGNRPVIRLCSTGLALVPLGFITAQADSWLWLAIVTFMSGAVAAGIELTNVNMITGLAPQVPRSTMSAIFSIVAGTCMAGASLLSGQLAHALAWVNEMDFELFGLPIVNYHILFGLSLLVRLVNATFVAPRLQEPSATSTLEAVKELLPEIIEGMAARLSRPVSMRAHED